MYRESSTAARERKRENASLWGKLVTGFFLAGYFTFLPIILTVLINWAVASFTMNNLYGAHWMMPALIILSTFLAGAFMRQKMEDEAGGMGLFVLGMLALLVFALLTRYDIVTHGGVYSHFMPEVMRDGVSGFVWFLPGVGVLGMLFYKYFTLKNYG